MYVFFDLEVCGLDAEYGYYCALLHPTEGFMCNIMVYNYEV